MYQELEKITKLLKGNILAIGLDNDSKLIELFMKNKKILNLFSLTNKSNKRKDRKKRVFKNKVINIKKIKKHFKKENIDYTFLRASSINNYLKSIIKNSIDITNKNIYFMCDEMKYDIEEIKYRFERHGCKINTVFKDNDNLLIINCENIKTKRFKNFLYYLRDINYELQEIIAIILIGA